MTILIAGIRAIVECDMKKIIALSTLSQLGVIIRSIGIALPDLAFFHLITHALFKALLFICAGLLIHFHHHAQDLRTLGSVTKQIPIASRALLIANMALCGMPFMAGFYSKDMILESLLSGPSSLLIVVIAFIATLLTAAYSLRLTFFAMWSPYASTPIVYANERSSAQVLPLATLSLGAVIRGAAFR